MASKTYKSVAENAAKLERNGNFLQASKCWGEASFLARKNANKEWSLSRCVFCRKMAIMPF